ncbi:aminotransferase class V-fold PLP-dependent enzyme [Lacibacter luteus]|uniref:cysteine desulfurase n=1 Tax=Lacibacter luteus TaxID=2508719 RepID=A0A4Q1CHV3_9BACT|nr:aminotransferase class V-fold PLP-dependent enzyme [Lacibacter luteus]RXK59619.1 aminotransferase class V-fold PLP-dependent enzyme [Lacibacter luteus]
MLQLPVYLDYNATTPCDPQVLEAMLPWFTTRFGNAASKTHRYGWEADEAISIAREQVAQLLKADASEIVFTSGATEAINLAIQAVFHTYTNKGKHIITWQTEHKAVLDTCAALEKQGADISYLPVNSNGRPDLDLLNQSIRPDTILIAGMFANNETGVLFPIRSIGAMAKEKQVLFFCDATQAVGKVPVDVQADGIDLLALSAHKIYGPKGVGALYVRRRNPRVKLTPLIYGGGHEKGLRSGTLNVPGIVGLGKACALAGGLMQTESGRLTTVRNQLLDGLLQTGSCTLSGSRSFLLPHVANLSFTIPGANQLIARLNQQLALSSGSACSSALAEPSHVLKAMGINDEAAGGSIRFSLGRFTTEEEVAFALETIKKILSE